MLGVLKELKGVPLFVKDTVEENAASTMVVGFALRVYMEVRISVSPMVVERGALLLGVQRVHEGAPTVV